MEKKKYSISQLSELFGVSEPAIRKKISLDNGTKRYRKRYEVVEELIGNKSTMFIMLDDTELDAEIYISKKNKNKFGLKQNVDSTLDNVEETPENVIYVEETPEIQQIDDFSQNDLLGFTKRYIEKVDNLYETLHITNKELLEKDKQIYMLEDFEKRTKEDITELQAINKTLSIRSKRYVIGLLIMFITLCITVVIFSIMLIKANNKPPKIEKVEVTKEIVKVVEKPVIKKK